MDAGARITKAARLELAAVIAPGVREARGEAEWIYKLARLTEKERRLRRKAVGRAADEALARAEKILAAYDVRTSKRVIHTDKGRTLSAADFREIQLRKLEIEFGDAAPIFVTCANCKTVFAVKAGTAKYRVPIVCKRGCLCACGRRMSRVTAIRAAHDGCLALCRTCWLRSPTLREVARKANASRRPEQKREVARKARASQTLEQKREAARKMNASRTPGQRSDAAGKAWASRRARAAAKVTP